MWTEFLLSRASLRRRPDRTELKNLLSYCRQNRGRIHAVIVYSISRFAREKYDHHVLRAQLATLQVTLRSATEPIDDSSAGKLMEGIIASMAQFDNDVRSERTVAGMKARLERGGWTFPPPLGFMATRDANGAKTIVPDPQRAFLVTRAFELFSTGLYSKQQVLEIVRGSGLTSKSGKRLSPQTFCQLLRNPIYAGVLEVPKWDMRQPSNTPALVSREIFDRVQALLDGKHPTIAPRQRNNPDFPLRNFARCGRCDRPLTGSWSTGRNSRYAYHRCQNRNCKSVNARREDMERLFVDFLGQLQPKSEYIRLFGEIIIDVWKQKQEQAIILHKAALRRVRELQESKQRLVEAFVYRREIDRVTYQEQLDKLNEEIALSEIAERDTRIDELDVQAAVSHGEFLLLNAPRLWMESSLEQKQRLQEVFFPRGVQFENGAYRTVETSMIFFELEEISAQNEGMVALPGIEPGFED
jgi:site-specific DNA recombinase